jgi:MFS family permease
MLLLLRTSQLSLLNLQMVTGHLHLHYRQTNFCYAFEGYILQKVLPGKWLGVNVILWGLVTASTAAVKNYHGLLACRILLGVFEAAMAPCLMLITGEDSCTLHQYQGNH